MVAQSAAEAATLLREKGSTQVTDVGAVRRSVSDVTLGNVAVAASVVAMLAAGPRVLGLQPFVGLALAWTATTLFGYGLAMPTEQLLSRRLSSGTDPRIGPPCRRLLSMAVLVSVVTGLWAAGSPAADVYPAMLPATLLGVWGWVVASIVRGRVAGQGDLRSYAWLFGAEAMGRLALVGGSLLMPAAAPALIGGAIGLPILLAGALGLSRLRGTPSKGPDMLARAATPKRTRNAAGTRAADRVEHIGFVLVAVGYQVSLNAAPIILERRLGGTPEFEAVGAFVIANSYYRLASVLAGGFATPALISLSQTWARRDAQAFARHLRRAVIGVTLVASAATMLAAALSPLALPLFYGRSPELATVVTIALASSTVVATAAAVTGTALMASGKAATAACCWLAGSLALTALIAADSDLSVMTAVGLLAGPCLTLSAMSAAVRRTSGRVR
ncbi:hypothetical protein GCM10027039_29140 [Terrabacter koreensis]